MKSLKSSLILFFLSAFMGLFSQEDYKPIIQRIESAPYIFEGVVIKSTPFLVSGGRYIHTSNTIEITKIFKGNLTCGTVEIITKGGKINNWSVNASHTLRLSEGFQGVFICGGTQKELSQIDFYLESNPEKLEAIFENQSFIKYQYDGNDFWASDMWQSFEDLPTLYSLLDTIIDTSYIDCTNTSLLVPPQNNNSEVIIDEIIEMPTYTKQAFDEIMEYADYTREHYTRIKVKNTNADKITYNIRNKKITGATQKFFEFDVMVKDNIGGKYLDQSAVRIEYDASMFGNYIVANNNIIVTRGTLNSDPVCYSSPIPQDKNSNTILIPAVEEVYSQCKAPIETYEQSIMHVKIVIQQCDIPSSVKLVDTATFFGPSLVINYCAYAEFPNDTFQTYYTELEHNQNETIGKCKTTITSFTPTTIAGGNRSVLTIKGYYFGNSQGKIYFPNADDGGQTYVYTDNLDFSCGNCIWSDTEIRFKIPSNFTPNDFSTVTLYPPGSGNFIVESNLTSVNNRDTSDTPLDINYSILNSPHKQPIYLGPETQFNKKYTFRCDSSVANYKNGAMKVVIEKALRDWTCVTGIHWELGTDTSIVGVTALRDSVCYISLSNLGVSFSGFPILALAQPFAVECTPAIYASTEIDIEISDIVDWFCDTLISNPVPAGQKDFYAAILHELGHAHNLNHVVDVHSIMHFAINNSVRMIELYSDNNTGLGGNWIMYNSLSIPLSNCAFSDNIELHPSPLCDPLIYSIHTVEENENISIYPNPTPNVINIVLDEELMNKDIQVKLSDIQGKLFMNTIIEGNSSNNLKLNLSSLNNGIYFISIKIDDNLYTKKIIKR